MTPEARERRNARQRERYASDPEYRERMLEAGRRRLQENGDRVREVRRARVKRWKLENREKWLAQCRRQNARRRERPEVAAENRRRVKEWNTKYPERALDGRLRYKYGITREEYLALLASQAGVCAICREPETATNRGKPILLAVDHDHVTGAVRALLCGRCNTGIGSFRDKPELLAAAVAYLQGEGV